MLTKAVESSRFLGLIFMDNIFYRFLEHYSFVPFKYRYKINIDQISVFVDNNGKEYPYNPWELSHCEY